MPKTIRLLAKANSIFDRAIDYSAIGAGILLTFIMLGITAEVFLRYGWNRPIPWMIEVVEYSLLWITFLGAAWLLKREGHVRVDTVLNRLKPIPRSLMNIITSIIGVVVSTFLFRYTVESAWFYYRTSYVLPTERHFLMYPIFVIIPIGLFLLLIQFLRRTYGYLRERRELLDQHKSQTRPQI